MLTNNLSTFIIGNRLRLWECLLRNVVPLALLMSLRPSGGAPRFERPLHCGKSPGPDSGHSFSQ